MALGGWRRWGPSSRSLCRSPSSHSPQPTPWWAMRVPRQVCAPPSAFVGFCVPMQGESCSHQSSSPAGDPGWPPLKPPDYKDVATDAALKSRPPPPPPMPLAERVRATFSLALCLFLFLLSLIHMHYLIMVIAPSRYVTPFMSLTPLPSCVCQEPSTVGSGPAPGPTHAKPLPPPYGSHCAAARLCTAGSAGSLERPKEPPPRPPWPRPPPPPGSSSQQIQQRISVPPSPVPPPERPEPPPPPPAAAVRPFASDKAARPQSPRRAPPTVNSSSIYHMYLQQAAPKAGSAPGSKPAAKAGEREASGRGHRAATAPCYCPYCLSFRRI